MVVGLGRSFGEVLLTTQSRPILVSNYLKANVPTNVIIETWEPEVGFLSDHNFHYPPQRLLSKGISYVWLEGPSPSKGYDFVQTQRPEYIVVGNFARWVDMYPHEVLNAYQLVTMVANYEVYKRKDLR